GKPLDVQRGDNGWEPIDVAASFKPLVLLSNRRTEPEDTFRRKDKEVSFDRVVFPGLVMPRLLQIREGQYPLVEQSLPKLKESLVRIAEQVDKGEKLIVPEYCLVRVIDVTVKPGESYQYRLRVRVANPNFKRDDVAEPKFAEGKELPSTKWFEIPG